MTTKERPILFSAPMVRALLAGKKTQTRRVVKAQPFGVIEVASGNHLLDYRHSYSQEDGLITVADMAKRCPYGQPGDRLWVRETWRVGAWDYPAHDRSNHHWIAVDYQADNYARKEWLCCRDSDRLIKQSIEDAQRVGIRPDANGRFSWEPGQSPSRWRPSIHMPRWASRILLEVTAVRVEQLQDISHSDAMAEGMAWDDAVYDYSRLWEQINGAASWAANPLVWVMEFRRVQP